MSHTPLDISSLNELVSDDLGNCVPLLNTLPLKHQITTLTSLAKQLRSFPTTQTQDLLSAYISNCQQPILNFYASTILFENFHTEPLRTFTLVDEQESQRTIEFLREKNLGNNLLRLESIFSENEAASEEIGSFEDQERTLNDSGDEEPKYESQPEIYSTRNDDLIEHDTENSNHLFDESEILNLDRMKDKLFSFGNEASRSVLEIEEISKLNDFSIEKLGRACEYLELDKISDEALSILCKCFATLDLSYSKCIVFLSKSLLPKAMDLQYKASRILEACFQTTAKEHPKAMIDAVLIPLCRRSVLGPAQMELIKRVTKLALSSEMNLDFLRSMLDSDDASTSGDWLEGKLDMVQHLLNLKLQISSELVNLLIVRLQENVDSFVNSVKFPMLIFQLISKYEPMIGSHVGSLKLILTKCTKPSAQMAIKKLDRIDQRK
eukprot:TRINITY_DN530_c0_g4_i1.p1 TRINITY_DN530_c0_g4~~TRINITY_DN530_c0_g4_i1.p1  ORF type:complete len:437 (-),score=66.81 TRINITY_DN530_c0_g4_i1:169-1479(-)